jgi:hypothetical protein
VTIYAVNGKEPIYAWIPSLDTAGNGTTTLSDLVSNRPGTLTNMDAATDWVADTDAGGVRAVDFDGSNDSVATAGNLTIGNAVSLSFWIKTPAAVTTTKIVFELTPNYNNAAGFIVTLEAGSLMAFGHRGAPDGYTVGTIAFPGHGGWHHIVLNLERKSAGIGDLSAFVNGASVSVTPAVVDNLISGNYAIARFFMMSRNTNSFHTAGRLDDIRMFSVASVLADVQYLYKNGNGRGRLPGGGIIPILRQHYAAQGAR